MNLGVYGDRCRYACEKHDAIPWIFEKNLHVPGIEPGSSAWKALILTIGLHVLSTCDNSELQKIHETVTEINNESRTPSVHGPMLSELASLQIRDMWRNEIPRTLSLSINPDLMRVEVL